MRSGPPRSRSAFTLVEMVVSVAIVVLLVALAGLVFLVVVFKHRSLLKAADRVLGELSNALAQEECSLDLLAIAARQLQ